MSARNFVNVNLSRGGVARAVKTGAAVSPTADIFLRGEPTARDPQDFRSQATPTSGEVAISSSSNLFFAIF